MKYLLLVALICTLVWAQDTADVIDDASRKINLELGGMIESIIEVKFRPAKGTKHFYHVVASEYEHTLVQIFAVKLSNNKILDIERLDSVPA